MSLAQSAKDGPPSRSYLISKAKLTSGRNLPAEDASDESQRLVGRIVQYAAHCIHPTEECNF